MNSKTGSSWKDDAELSNRGRSIYEMMHRFVERDCEEMTAKTKADLETLDSPILDQMWDLGYQKEVRSLLELPTKVDSIGFKCWLGLEHWTGGVSGPVDEVDLDEKGNAIRKVPNIEGVVAVFQLFTEAESLALVRITKEQLLMGKSEEELRQAKEKLAAAYTGRENTLRKNSTDHLLTAIMYNRIVAPENDPSGELQDKFDRWELLCGMNADLRLVRTQPAQHEVGVGAGRHMKHVDTMEYNKHFSATKKGGFDRECLPSRMSIYTAQCYLENPEIGGQFEIFPKVLNLVNPTDPSKGTILFEQQPEAKGLELVRLRFQFARGQCAIFPQQSDCSYHGGSKTFGAWDKVAIRAVLDARLENLREDISQLQELSKEEDFARGYTTGESSEESVDLKMIWYGKYLAGSFTDDATSIKNPRMAQRNTVNCVSRRREK